MSSRLRALMAAALLASPSAFAEAYQFNLHIEPGLGEDLTRSGFVSGASLKLDFGSMFGQPVAPQAELFGLGTANNNLLVSGALFGGAIGLRWRVLNDEHGYFFMPGQASGGNLWGNLWVDAMVAVGTGSKSPRVGFTAGVGYEFSLVDGLQIGPYAKVMYLQEALLIFGLSFSIGGPQTVPVEFDPDGDGIKGDADKCPNEAEDLDGFEDEDGCPEFDNDHDDIPDAKDRCPTLAEDKDGFEDEDGCPDLDND
jgi:hypothetical protein